MATEEMEPEGYPVTIMFPSIAEKKKFNKGLKALMAKHGFESRDEAATFAVLKALEIEVPRKKK